MESSPFYVKSWKFRPTVTNSGSFDILKKNYIEDIQLFDIEYGIYFTSETGFLIFSWVQSMSENMKQEAHGPHHSPEKTV